MSRVMASPHKIAIPPYLPWVQRIEIIHEIDFWGRGDEGGNENIKTGEKISVYKRALRHVTRKQTTIVYIIPLFPLIFILSLYFRGFDRGIYRGIVRGWGPYLRFCRLSVTFVACFGQGHAG